MRSVKTGTLGSVSQGFFIIKNKRKVNQIKLNKEYARGGPGPNTESPNPFGLRDYWGEIILFYFLLDMQRIQGSQ